MIELRSKLLPPSDRVTVCAAVGARLRLDGPGRGAAPAATSGTESDGVFITAEGLLMYLQPDEAMGLITECARRFPGGQMMFDLPPSWFAR